MRALRRRCDVVDGQLLPAIGTERSAAGVGEHRPHVRAVADEPAVAVTRRLRARVCPRPAVVRAAIDLSHRSEVDRALGSSVELLHAVRHVDGAYLGPRAGRARFLGTPDAAVLAGDDPERARGLGRAVVLLAEK